MKALLISLTVLGAIVAGMSAVRVRPAPPTVSIRTDTGTVTVRVEVARTPEAWSRGLMGRQTLAENTGMLFIFPDDTVRTFWMKDTVIPLDVIFVNASGAIVSIKTMAPCVNKPACPTYESGVPARYALEVAAGFAARNGVRPGDALTLPAGTR